MLFLYQILTFNLPDLINKFIEGGTIGISHNPGLPNITGNSGYGSQGDIQTGAFTVGSSGTTCLFAGRETSNVTELDASKSNSIYGNSNTVQPASLEMNYCIKY